jgi:hypothetical protein
MNLRIMLGKKHLDWICCQNFRSKKNSSCKFSQSLVRKHLSWTHVSLCHVTLPWKGKVRHHWDNKKNKCQIATSLGSCVSLSNGKQNAICTSHSKVVGMWLYNWRQWKFKWKDSKTSNDKTQVQVDVDEVGIKEGIELKWS